MRVLMLGWEFPPFITGGLGTACYGLTKALDRRGIEVIFVLPKTVDRSSASHVQLVSPEGRPIGAEHSRGSAAGAGAGQPGSYRFEHLRFIGVPAHFSSPYARPGESRAGTGAARRALGALEGGPLSPVLAHVLGEVLPEARHLAGGGPDEPLSVAADYNGDLIMDVHRYASFCLKRLGRERFDVIHAHDWLTYPAGLAIARLSGKPLVVHVHSTEFDRSGLHVNQRIYDIERRGMHGAIRVITVSQLTKNIVTFRYGVPEHHVDVVYNGVEFEPTQPDRIGIRSKDKIVLYFGRITMQKGPEYFIQAAKRVLDVMDNVKFVVAGSGDMATRMIEMAARLGIGHKVLFTGFLRGNDIRRVFAMADLYVMPSVSEPFGIAPLEAMGHDVPVLISKSSGVSEVLSHALKVDFWDTDDMANKIMAVLRHPTLSHTLRAHGRFEVRRLTWDGAADRCEQVYRAAIAQISATRHVHA